MSFTKAYQANFTMVKEQMPFLVDNKSKLLRLSIGVHEFPQKCTKRTSEWEGTEAFLVDNKNNLLRLPIGVHEIPQKCT